MLAIYLARCVALFFPQIKSPSAETGATARGTPLYLCGPIRLGSIAAFHPKVEVRRANISTPRIAASGQKRPFRLFPQTGAKRFASDAKDYDITGAMFVNGDGNDIFSMLMFWQGFVWSIDTGRLMGDLFIWLGTQLDLVPILVAPRQHSRLSQSELILIQDFPPGD